MRSSSKPEKIAGVSRLTSLEQNLPATDNDQTLTFGYTSASQIASRGATNDAYHWAAPAVNAAYNRNGLNQYTSVGGVTFSYAGGDGQRGNLTSDGSRSFDYDLENRLISVSGSASLTLGYDPLGRLHQTTASSTTTTYLYDGDRLVGEYNGSTLTERYVHGAGVDEPLVWYHGAGATDRRYLIADNQGSIIAESGASTTRYTYGSYGEPSSWSGSRFRYTGQIALPEVALYHYKARVYDAVLGRFLQTDPVGYQEEWNLYAYVRNDPINGTDWTGRQVVTARERAFAAAGKVQAFWQSRADRGDPIGDTSLQYGEGEQRNEGVAFASNALDGALLAKHAASSPEGATLIPQGAIEAAVKERAEVRIDLMNAHIAAVDSDNSGVPHSLSANQIADYHHEVFEQHGLAASVFGGTPATGENWETTVTNAITGWCAQCDH